MEALEAGARIDIRAAARRLEGKVRRTPLEALPVGEPRVELRVKLECLQETNSFKARGATNQICMLTPAEGAAGVCCTSSGNHGRAVAWAARQAGVKATIYMDEGVYPNKIAACRDEGAEVVLASTREAAEKLCEGAVAAGATLVHPYAAGRTVEGAGTVGLEIAQDWPEVELVLFPVGGGGMIAGGSLAIARELGDEVAVIGVEPEGAPNLSRALEESRVVTLEEITTTIQGLCPLDTGEVNLALAARYVEGMITLTDEEILDGQRVLVQAGWTVEPAGGAAVAAVIHGALPEAFLEGRDASNPLRVAAVVSGGNPDPAQLASLK
jgi:threonine dehydratase